MQNLSYTYKKIVEKLESHKDHYPEKNLCVFTAASGLSYNRENGLMVIGRSPNGWANFIDKMNPSTFNEVVKSIERSLKEDNLNWVKERWGTKVHSYNSKKSQFWRVAKSLSSAITQHDGFEIDAIAYSNLYKVSNDDGPNPSSKLQSLQFDFCKGLLFQEFDYYKPKVAVLLTGLDWAKPFLNEIAEIKTDYTQNSFVTFVGKYDSTLIIVGKHPQGKSEQEQVAEILNEVNTYSLG